MIGHDRIFTANRLRGLALLFERGQLDAEFAAVNAPIAAVLSTVVQRIRQLADAIESPDA